MSKTPIYSTERRPTNRRVLLVAFASLALLFTPLLPSFGEAPLATETLGLVE